MEAIVGTLSFFTTSTAAVKKVTPGDSAPLEHF